MLNNKEDKILLKKIDHTTRLLRRRALLLTKGDKLTSIELLWLHQIETELGIT